MFLLNTCYDVVSSAESALRVESARGPAGVGEGEHLLFEGNASVQALLRNRKSRSMDCWDGGWGEKNSTWGRIEKGSMLPQAPEHPATDLRGAGCKFQTKNPVLNNCLFLLCSCCFLFVGCEQWCKHCFAGCKGVGRRERRCSCVQQSVLLPESSTGLLLPKSVSRTESAKVRSPVWGKKGNR